MTNETLERQVIELIATDRIEIPISSMSGKLKRQKPKLAEALGLSNDGAKYAGDRVYARVKAEDKQKARGMKEGIAKFAEEFPKYARILIGYIEEQRTLKETHLYFGANPGARLTSEDYMNVMRNLGFSEPRSESMYQELMAVSRNLSKKRDETERSILIGKSGTDSED